MANERSDVTAREGFVRRWGRRLVTLLAMLVTLVVMVIAMGTLVYLPLRHLSPFVLEIVTLATLLDSMFTLHVFLVGLVGVALAWWARRLGVRRTATIVLGCAMLATVGSAVPLLALAGSAHQHGAPISWTAHLNLVSLFRPGPPTPHETQLFATVDGHELFADIYRPVSTPALSAPVVMIHGGGFVDGARSDADVWDRWLAERGYTVFDVDYRLAPPVTWNLAAEDVVCAMAWVAAHATDYHISPDRLLIAGQSAGGGLALQVAYGLGDETVTSSCGGTVPQPKAVFAIYPPEDLGMCWDINPGLLRPPATAYIGGSPQEFPERYRVVSPVFHVRSGLPPTLIVAGTHDHVVPFEGHLEIVEKLNAVGVPNELLSVPYGEHSYDARSRSLGSQITRTVAADFLDKYLPAKQ